MPNSFFHRLLSLDPPTNGPTIPVHQIMSAMGEVDRGKMTRAQVLTAFDITVGEESDYDAFAAKIKTPQESYALCGRVTLTNVGAAYDTTLDSQALPFIYIQRAGVIRIDMEVRVRKVGTGTQDWQLFDETNGVEAVGPATITSGSLSDNGAAADRTLNGSRVFASPLSPQVVKLRLRSRSSTALDDPIFLNAAILLFRESIITPEVVHQVLCLGSYGIAGYSTVAELKARLGIP